MDHHQDLVAVAESIRERLRRIVADSRDAVEKSNIALGKSRRRIELSEFVIDKATFGDSRRQTLCRRHIIIYEYRGVEIARYAPTAETALKAEIKTSALFFKQHPAFDVFALNPGLKFRFADPDT